MGASASFDTSAPRVPGVAIAKPGSGFSEPSGEEKLYRGKDERLDYKTLIMLILNSR